MAGMMKTSGRWVKLYESLLDWEWHDVPEVLSLFMHLLLLAQHKDYEWHGTTIERGQLVTTLAKLSELTHISVQTLRTGLARLEATGEITQKSTNKYRIVTICKYDEYQARKQPSQQTTNKQLTNNQQTNKQEYIYNTEAAVVGAGARTREKVFEPSAVEAGCRTMCIDSVTYCRLAEQVFAEWELNPCHGEHDMTHFLNTMRIKAEAWRKERRQAEREQERERRRVERERRTCETPLERRQRAGREIKTAIALDIVEAVSNENTKKD